MQVWRVRKNDNCARGAAQYRFMKKSSRSMIRPAFSHCAQVLRDNAAR